MEGQLEWGTGRAVPKHTLSAGNANKINKMRQEMDNYRNLRHNKTDQSFIQKIFTNKKIIVYDMYNSSYHDFYLYVVPLIIQYLH